MSNKKNHKPEETQENQNTKNNAGEQAKLPNTKQQLPI